MIGGAFLSDWGRSFHCREKIADWSQSDNISVQSNLRIIRIAERDGVYHARVAVTGNGFSGEGDMAFTLNGDRIASLIIS
ncbi:nuclear transport factor 2 family protein [Mesorhizobium sp. B2-7-2]|uniref:nuclear transport factor 2 family protein n=1 Tax=Mesorhizobium sp. B2-7-2 TaxID=2589908 RepID=UPI00112AD3F0|nr:nuclear transport factor 2 family protein [Mesorhizobium sp. B2-7-2]TPJ27308.1 nuclear transport factor 2 family protein [Mesorhizobium sp. B2-7-2]